LASASDPLTVEAGAEASVVASVSSVAGALATGASSSTSVVSTTGAETVSS